MTITETSFTKLRTSNGVLVGFQDRAAEAAFMAANKGVHGGAATFPTTSLGDVEVTLSWTNVKPTPGE